MRVWLCLWTIALLSVACASDLSAGAADLSAGAGYSAIIHESDFYVDKITITNNLNASIQNITLRLPEDVKVFNFWQFVGDKYYLAWHSFPDNYTISVRLETPVEKVGILLMVYKREGVITGGSAATPDSVAWQGGQASPPLCEPDQCPVEVKTEYVPVTQVRTEAPPYLNVMMFLLLVIIIVMGLALSYDKVSSALGLPSDMEVKMDAYKQLKDTLDGSPTRKNVLDYIGDKMVTNAELARAFRMTKWGMSKHMGRLEAAGLVERETRQGRKHKWYKLTEKGGKIVKET